MRVTKMSEISRNQFESWHAREKAAFIADGELEAARLLDAVKDVLFSAWKASREILEVELPKPDEIDTRDGYREKILWPDDVAEAIREQGLRCAGQPAGEGV